MSCQSDADCVVLLVTGPPEACGVPPAIAASRDGASEIRASKARSDEEREADAAARQECLATCQGVECDRARSEDQARCVGSGSLRTCQLERTKPQPIENPFAVCVGGTGNPEALAAEGGECDAEHPRACLARGDKFESDFRDSGRSGRLSLLFACESYDAACAAGLQDACGRCRRLGCHVTGKGP